MVTAPASDLSAVVLLGGFSDNLPPILFLTLIIVCGLMIVGGAVFDMMGDRVSEPKADIGDEAAAGKTAAKAEKAKAKAEAKARQKAEKAEKAAAAKAAKAAKGKKGKAKAAAKSAEPPAVEPEAASFEETGEEQAAETTAESAAESPVEFGDAIDFTDSEESEGKA